MHMRPRLMAGSKDSAATGFGSWSWSWSCPNCTWHFAAQTEISPTNNIGRWPCPYPCPYPCPCPYPVDSGLPLVGLLLLLLKWLNQQTAGRWRLYGITRNLWAPRGVFWPGGHHYGPSVGVWPVLGIPTILCLNTGLHCWLVGFRFGRHFGQLKAKELFAIIY